MKSLSQTLEVEFDTPADKASLLSLMLEQTNEFSTPRFVIGNEKYMRSLNPDDDENIQALTMLNGYINSALTMEEFCVKYKRHLKFDPVKRS